MSIIHKTRVSEIASNTPVAGTAFNLPSSAATGYKTFASAYATTNRCPCFATNGVDWESFIGTLASGTPWTLARTTLLESSTGSAINWSLASGSPVTIFVEMPATTGQYATNTGLISVSSDATTTQAFSGNTVTKVTTALTTELVDIEGWWDLTNSKFLPTRPGVFLIIASLQLNSVADAVNVQSILYKNGTAYAYGPSSYCSVIGGAPASSISSLISLNGSSDYVEYYYYNGDSSTRSNVAGVGRVTFQAIYQGPSS